MRPYWQSDDGSITVYHARFEDVLAAGCVPVREVKLVHADPPYGIGGASHRPDTAAVPRVKSKAWPVMVNNDVAFDPTALLALDRPLALWGANHYGNLPSSPSWILWDKRDGTTPDKSADGELAWTNLGGPLRIFRHMWRHFCRASESGAHLGPTQKPIALSAYVFQRAKLKPGDLVLVPYLGSGPDLPAARAMGLKIIACDVERWCCDTAIGRLGAVTPERAAEPVGPLFAGGS